MTRFDMLIIALIALSAWLGWSRGGVRELVTIVAIGAGFVVLGVFGAPLSSMASGTLARIGLLFGLFAGVYLGVLVLGHWGAGRWLGDRKIAGDRIAGTAFGAVRGWVLSAFLYFSITVYHTGTALPETIQRSIMAPALGSTVRLIIPPSEDSVTELSKGVRRAIPFGEATTEA